MRQPGFEPRSTAYFKFFDYKLMEGSDSATKLLAHKIIS